MAGTINNMEIGEYFQKEGKCKVLGAAAKRGKIYENFC